MEEQGWQTYVPICNFHMNLLSRIVLNFVPLQLDPRQFFWGSAGIILIGKFSLYVVFLWLCIDFHRYSCANMRASETPTEEVTLAEKTKTLKELAKKWGKPKSDTWYRFVYMRPSDEFVRIS